MKFDLNRKNFFRFNISAQPSIEPTGGAVIAFRSGVMKIVEIVFRYKKREQWKIVTTVSN